MGKAGKTILSVLALLAAGSILYGVALPTETSRDYEQLADPVGVALGISFVLYASLIWLLEPRRWTAVSIFTVLVALTAAAAYGLRYL